MGGSSSQGSFSAHVVEDLWAGDARCLCGDLSLWDLSWCLDEELCESLSWDPGHAFEDSECLWWEDFLPREPMALGRSPFLLVELGTSPELRQSWDVSSS